MSFSAPIQVGYEFSVYTTNEGDGFIELCAVVNSHPAGSPRPFTFAATTEDGVASMIFIISQLVLNIYVCQISINQQI